MSDQITQAMAGLRTVKGPTAEEQAAQERAKSLDRLLRFPKLPYRLAQLVLGPLTETPAMLAVRELLAGKCSLVVLAGQAGCGKSIAAAWACSERQGSRFVHAASLAVPQEDGLDRRMAECRLLVVDDVGTEYVTEKRYASSRIEAAVVARDASGDPTILTTNLLPEVFRERYGERIASRINGDAIGWVSLPAEDLRQRRRP